jgi:diacylglycerol kinase family enzyme
MRYVLGVLEETRYKWSLEEVLLKLDHQTPQSKNLFMLSIAKGRREGSFTLAPRAKLDDGLLHITTASDLLRRDVIRYLPGVCFGRLPRSDARIRYLTASRITLKTQSAIRFHLDGELFADGRFTPNQEVEVNVLPQRLKIHFVESPG